MKRAARWRLLTTAAVVSVLWLSERDAYAPVQKSLGVNVAFTGIRGSKDGEAFVDPELGEIGEKLKKKLGLKRLEIIDKTEIAVNTKWLATQSFGDGLKIELSMHPLRGDVASFTVKVWKEVDDKKAEIIRENLKIKLNDVGFAFGKMGRDVLILMMVPSRAPEEDE